MSDTAPLDFRAETERLIALLGKQIFFVGVAVKSGTSWFQRLLDQHPQISCGGESHFGDSLLPALTKTLEEHDQRVLGRELNPLRHELGEPHPRFECSDLRYLAAAAILISMRKQSAGKSVLAVGERTTNNVTMFGGFLELFPPAKCIQIVRDPRDAGVSLWSHARRHAPAEMKNLVVPAWDIVRQNAGAWTEAVDRGVRFGERNPGRYFELRYGDLVEQTAPTLARVFRFLGVDDSLEVAQECARAASFERLSGGRARGQENPESFFRKGVVGDWKNHLDADTNDYVIATAGAPMRRFGYL